MINNIHYLYMLLCIIPITILGLYLFSQKDIRSQATPFIAMVWALWAWIVPILIFYNTSNPQLMRYLSNCAYIAASLFFPFLAHFVKTYQNNNQLTIREYLKLYLSQSVIIPVILLHLVIRGFNPAEHLPLSGSMYLLFFAQVIGYYVYSLVLIRKRIAGTTGKLNLQMRYFFWLTITSPTLCIFTNAVIPYVLFPGIKSSFLGPIAIMIFILGIYYIITRHAFLDIKVIFRKSLILSILIALYTLGYLASTYYLGKILPIGLQSMLVILAIVTYTPVKNSVSSMLDKTFFHLNMEYQEKFREISENTLLIQEEGFLIEYLLQKIKELYNPSRIELFPMDKLDKITLNKVQNILRKNKNAPNQLCTELKKSLGADTEAAYVLWNKDEVRAIATIGLKYGYEYYTRQDRQFLQNLFNNASLAITNIINNQNYIQSLEKLVQARQLATIGELAASLAHEIRNPLSGILFTMEIIQDQLKDQSNSEHITSLCHNVTGYTTALHDKLQSMLKMSRPHQPELSEVNLESLFNDVLFLINKHAQKNRIHIEKQINLDNPDIRIDATQMKQALLNLCLNSIEAMPQGGKLTLTGTPGINHLEIKVKDTGAGIAPELLSRIYDPFFTTKNDGTGIGLAVVKKIVEEHQGSIMVKTRKGQGTEFLIALPR